jgi:hypothetical protein
MFPQILGIKSPFIRKWTMYDFKRGTYHIDAYDAKSNVWLDISFIEGFSHFFYSENNAKLFINNLLKVYPKAIIKIKKFIPKEGYVYIEFK